MLQYINLLRRLYKTSTWNTASDAKNHITVHYYHLYCYTTTNIYCNSAVCSVHHFSKVQIRTIVKIQSALTLEPRTKTPLCVSPIVKKSKNLLKIMFLVHPVAPMVAVSNDSSKSITLMWALQIYPVSEFALGHYRVRNRSYLLYINVQMGVDSLISEVLRISGFCGNVPGLEPGMLPGLTSARATKL